MPQPQCSAALNLSPSLCLKALVPASAPSASCPGSSLHSLHLPAIYYPQPSKVSDLSIPPSLPTLLCEIVILWWWADFQSSHSACSLSQTASTPHCFQKTLHYFIPSNCLGKHFPPMMHLSLPFHFIILNTSCTAELAVLWVKMSLAYGLEGEAGQLKRETHSMKRTQETDPSFFQEQPQFNNWSISQRMNVFLPMTAVIKMGADYEGTCQHPCQWVTSSSSIDYTQGVSTGFYSLKHQSQMEGQLIPSIYIHPSQQINGTMLLWHPQRKDAIVQRLFNGVIWREDDPHYYRHWHIALWFDK